MFRAPGRPSVSRTRGCQSSRGGLSGETRLLAGVLAPEVDDLSAVEPHLRALVDLDDPAGRSVRSGRRPAGYGGAPGSGGTSSIQPPRASTSYVLHVVRLPERSRVGRDREAPDLDTCCARPTARRTSAVLAPTHEAARRAPRWAKPRRNHEPDAERRAGGVRAARCRGSRRRRRRRAQQPSQSDRPRSCGDERDEHERRQRRAGRVVSRLRWTSCQTRYGCSVARSAPTSPIPVGAQPRPDLVDDRAPSRPRPTICASSDRRATTARTASRSRTRNHP